MKNYINDLVHDDVPKLKLILEYLYSLNLRSQRDFENINVLFDTSERLSYCKLKGAVNSIGTTLIIYYNDGRIIADFNTSINRIHLLGSSRILHNSRSNEYLVQDIDTHHSSVLTGKDVFEDYFALSTTINPQLLNLVGLHSEVYKLLPEDMQGLSIGLFQDCIEMIPKIYDELPK